MTEQKSSVLGIKDDEAIKITGENLEFASFRNCKIEKCFFDRCNLSGADYKGVTIQNTKYSYCNLDSADFSGATLSNVYFHKCSLDGAVFNRASLEDIYGVPYIPPVELLDSFLRPMFLSGKSTSEWRTALCEKSSQMCHQGHDSGMGYLIIRKALPTLDLDKNYPSLGYILETIREIKVKLRDN